MLPILRSPLLDPARFPITGPALPIPPEAETKACADCSLPRSKAWHSRFPIMDTDAGLVRPAVFEIEGNAGMREFSTAGIEELFGGPLDPRAVGPIHDHDLGDAFGLPVIIPASAAAGDVDWTEAAKLTTALWQVASEPRWFMDPSDPTHLREVLGDADGLLAYLRDMCSRHRHFCDTSFYTLLVTAFGDQALREDLVAKSKASWFKDGEPRISTFNGFTTSLLHILRCVHIYTDGSIEMGVFQQMIPNHAVNALNAQTWILAPVDLAADGIPTGPSPITRIGHYRFSCNTASGYVDGTWMLENGFRGDLTVPASNIYAHDYLYASNDAYGINDAFFHDKHLGYHDKIRILGWCDLDSGHRSYTFRSEYDAKSFKCSRHSFLHHHGLATGADSTLLGEENPSTGSSAGSGDFIETWKDRRPVLVVDRATPIFALWSDLIKCAKCNGRVQVLLPSGNELTTLDCPHCAESGGLSIAHLMDGADRPVHGLSTLDGGATEE